MANKKYAQKKAEQFIYAALERLVVLYQKAVACSEWLNTKTKEYNDFIAANEELEDMCGDSRKRSRMVFMMALVVLTIFVDTMLTYHALDILCSTTGLPEIYKSITPVILVLLEVVISYISFTGTYQSSGRASWILRLLPYSVLIILIGLSLSVIVYLLINFGSMPMYSIGTIFYQVILLCGSVFLHILIIMKAVEIGEAITLIQYLFKRGHYLKKMNEAQKAYDTAKNRFMKETAMIERDIYEFHTEFPDNTVDFTIGVPDEVVKAANRVMGRDIFRKNNTDHTQIPD